MYIHMLRVLLCAAGVVVLLLWCSALAARVITVTCIVAVGTGAVAVGTGAAVVMYWC